MIPNQRFLFVPPGGSVLEPIVILGLQDFSPGQTHKVQVWKFTVPPGAGPEHLSQEEPTSWSGVLRTLARYFPGEDEASLRQRITS
jgi:hypothetical protein